MEKKVLFYAPIGNPARKWKQDRFIISTFNGIAADIRRGFLTAKEAGFNLIETGWSEIGQMDEVIPIAEETDTKLVVQDWRIFGGFQDTRYTEIDPEKLPAYLEYTKRYNCIAGYYVMDEPYSEDSIHKAAKQVDILEAADPERLPFSCALPSYNAKFTYANGLYESYLRSYCDEIRPPVFCFDYYDIAHIKDCQLDRSNIYKDLYLVHRITEEKKIPFWFYLQAIGDLEDMKGEVRYVEAKHIVMQAHLALLFGAVALDYYLNYSSVVEYATGAEGVHFETCKALNRKVLMWGRTLMVLHCRRVYHSAEVLPEDESFRKDFMDQPGDSELLSGEELPFRISASESEDDYGNQYLFVMNRDYDTPTEVSLKLKKRFHVYEINDDTGNQVLTGDTDTLRLNLSPAGAKLFRLQDAEEEPYLVDYTLKK